ncbi:integrase catalytic domain-containing protein [Luteimonas terrae]|uniref:Transposase n=1 Tax=Luteimonas terrae TaxID=1530191 RepID=A0A4R5U8X7_9GAMM|nr:DDE-type integrase/transposase/recombinase [Luteimonas terrae]TDK30949.1 transposase [Luteimonas terrae]
MVSGAERRQRRGGASNCEHAYEVLAQNLRSRDLPKAVSEEILSMCREPSRRVGDRALTNVITRFQSKKNGSPRLLESTTVELQLAYELERDSTVLAYFNQVACRRVERFVNNGKHHISTITVDFLIVREDSLTLVECKNEDRLEKLRESKPQEWIYANGMPLHRPLLKWAEERGLRYETWCPRYLDGIWLSNLEMMFGAAREEGVNGVTQHLIARIENQLRVSSKTIYELLQCIDKLTVQNIALLLWGSVLYGPERRIRISDTTRFHVFLNKEAAEEHELRVEKQALLDASPVTSWIANASTVDFSRAIERQKALLAAEDHGRALNRYEKRIKKKAPSLDLQDLATSFHKSGNRTRRISHGQIEILASVVKEDWEGGAVSTLSTLCSRVNHALAEAGCRPVSRTTIARAARKVKDETRALNIGGMRGFQSARTASDPRVRTLMAQATLESLQIDSTVADQFVLLYEDKPKLGKSTVYVAVDCNTKDYVGFAMGPGESDRNALGSILRDVVRRHGSLPGRLLVDRGPELTSKFVREIADRYGMSVSFAPTGSGRTKSFVETAFKRANNLIFDELPGSTRNDKKGRSVDGRFKGRATAALRMSRQVEIVESIILEEIPRITDDEGISPRDRFNEVDRPRGGIRISDDDEFMFWTSVPSTSQRIDPCRGLRLSTGTYVSNELLSAARRGQMVEARLDCEDPSLAWVRTTVGFVKAWNSEIYFANGLSLHEKKMMHFRRRTERATKRKEQPGQADSIRQGLAQAVKGELNEKKKIEVDGPRSDESKATVPPSRISIPYDEIGEV